MVRPFRVALDPVGIGHANARRGAVPREHDVAVEIDLGEIGELAIGRDHGPHIVELQLVDDVGHPVLAESVPGEHVDAARASEQRPECDLHRARVGGEDDADPIAGWQLQQLARLDKRKLEPRPRVLGPMVAAEQGAPESAKDQPGCLVQGPDEKRGLAGCRLGLDGRIMWARKRELVSAAHTFSRPMRQARGSRGPGRAKKPPVARGR